MSQAADRLAVYYNPGDHDPATNPGGMAAGGHRDNFIPALRDLAAVTVEVAANAAKAEESAAALRGATLSGGGLVIASPTDTEGGSLAAKLEVVGLDKSIVNVGGNERVRLKAQDDVGSTLYLAQTCNAF